jgi:hypothetical protein
MIFSKILQFVNFLFTATTFYTRSCSSHCLWLVRPVARSAATRHWLEGRPHRQRGRECWRWRYRTNGTAKTGAFEPRLHNNPNSAIAVTLWSSEHHRRWPTTTAHSGIRRKPATDHDSMLEYILKKRKLTLMQMGRSMGSLVVRGECMVHLSGKQLQKESGQISDDPQV